MKRVTILKLDGTQVEHRCVSTGWGQESRNLVLRDVASDQPGARSIPYVVYPLHSVQWFKEDDNG